MSDLVPQEAAALAEVQTDAARRRAEIGPGGLRGRVARGTIINTLYIVSINGLTILQGLLMARILGAGEYGLWGLLAISFGTLFALAAIGLDDKYIQQDRPDQRAAFELAFTLQSMLCGLFTVIALIAIPLFSLLYDEPRILAPGLLLAMAMPLIALQTPIWVFYRRMDFAKQRLLQSVQPVSTFVVTLTLAALGLGFWALVIGTFVGSLLTTASAIVHSPYKLRFRYEKGAIREYATFSWPLLVGSASGVLTFQIPVTLAARTLGPAAVGAITLASQITQYTRRVDDIVTHALYPAICAVKDQRDLLFESFSKSNRLALLWGFPTGVAAVLFAPEAVPLVLGEQWELAVPLVQLLGLAAALEQIGFNWTAFARARGETRILGANSVLLLVVVTAVGVPLLLEYGLPGLGVGLLAGTFASLAVRIRYLSKLFSVRSIGLHVVRSFVPTLPAAAVIGAERALTGGSTSVGRLLAELAVYAVVVALVTWVVERKLLREALGYVRQRARTSEAQADPATRLA